MSFLMDRVSIPAYARAVSALLAIGSRVFELVKNPTNPERDEAAVEHWYTLRHTAAVWLREHSTQLATDEREKLHGALRFAHELAHDLIPGPLPSVEHCNCPTAALLREMALLRIADVTGVDVPGVAA